MFTFREKLSQVPPFPKDYNVMPPPLRNASPSHVATIYNKLTGGGGGWCVSTQTPSLPGSSFMHVWPFVCCLFQHLLSPQLGFQDKLTWHVRLYHLSHSVSLLISFYTQHCV
jgi:hypothetical protein